MNSSVMNVFCTEYDIVTRVARKYLGFRTKEYDGLYVPKGWSVNDVKSLYGNDMKPDE